MRPETRAKGTGSPEVKPAPSERGLGAGAAGSPAAGGAPTAAELRATAGLDVLREALEVLARVVRARGDTYIEASELGGHVRVRSVHECYCGG